MSEKKAINKQKARRQDHNKKTGKYAKQKERTFENKTLHQLENAAKHDMTLLALFEQEHGGRKNILRLAQVPLNLEGMLSSLASRAGLK